MKLLIAIIRETQLDQVREALAVAKIERITVSRVSGHGRQMREEIYRGQRVIPSLTPKVKIEIALNDDFVDVTVEAIMKGARTADAEQEAYGNVGDGKIFILPMEDCIRIRTGERGAEAV